ncbi:MAG: phosphoribosylanthranilate isomerase [Gammaproteobacteria bacterium]|nr:phosphoribosylanthranilate isomerase [Gammaproteobacteria bacterium]
MITRIKVCGLRHEQDIALCVEEGVNALGFVVEYPVPTPWDLTRERAAALMRVVPPFVSRVAVVGGDADSIMAICAVTRPDSVQLHYDESEETVAELKARLADTGITIIRALRIPIAGSRTAAAGDESLPRWEAVARRFRDAGADAILLDSRTDDSPAATGKPFDWRIAERVSAAVSPVILAGGLKPENVGGAIAAVRPHAVDVLTAMEDAQHRKLRDRVRAFVHAVRETDTV